MVFDYFFERNDVLACVERFAELALCARFFEAALPPAEL
jgi:hypothetical protein